MKDTRRRSGATTHLPEILLEGVSFRCTDCGACCSGAPGKVRISEEETQTISEFREQSLHEFLDQETRMVDGELLLKEKPNGDCIFFKNNRCQIHHVKPRQCRTYPFWFKNVRSAASWEKTCSDCPGIGEGEYFPAERIVDVVEDELEKLRLFEFSF